METEVTRRASERPSRPFRCLATCLCACLASGFLVSAAGGDIIGDIDRIGYSDVRGPLVRTGCWIPVQVSLSLQNQTSFTGRLRLRQIDRDGDIYVDSVPVQLYDDGSGGNQRSYWLYTVANPLSERQHGFTVELLESQSDDDPGRIVPMISGGSPVTMLRPAMPPEVVQDESLVVLELSDGALGRIRRLVDPEAVGNIEFDRELRLAHLAPRSLPNRWIGLEMIDCIVWDEADPTVLSEAQEEALVEWLRQGGRLVLAAAQTADAVQSSEQLGPLLPVRIGPVRSVQRLPETRNRLLRIVSDDAASDAGYDRPVPLAICTALDEPDVRRMLFEQELNATVVATRRVGRGQLTFVAAALKDLTADPEALPVYFYMNLLELRKTPFSVDNVMRSVIPLFRYLDREVGFYGTGSARLAVAILFSIVYAVLATLGVWKFLQSRGMLKHSWTGLALVAGAATFVSMVGVQSIHGVGRDTHQLTVVDGVAGRTEALGTAYFGVTTSIRSNLDVWLPEDPLLSGEPGATVCSLKPMLDWRDTSGAEVQYTDPARYEILPSTAEIHDVPVRATLKQFEGRWRGNLQGTIRASIAVTRRTPIEFGAENESDRDFAITPDSWILNDLGADLQQCYLLVAEQDAYIPQTYTSFSPRSERGMIQAYPLGTILKGERIVPFDRIYRTARGGFLTAEERRRFGLDDVQGQWGRRFAAVDNMGPWGGDANTMVAYDLTHYQNVLLLLTVLAEINPTGFSQTQWGGYPVFSRTRCRHLDMSDLLNRDTAILVGFSEEPGPIRLGVRTGNGEYRMAQPERARTVYRFVIPMGRTGS